MATSFMNRVSRTRPNRIACCRGFVETFAGQGYAAGRRSALAVGGTIRRFLRLSSHLGGLTLIPTRRPYRQNSAVLVHRGRSTQGWPPPIGGTGDGSLRGHGRFHPGGRCRLVLRRGESTVHGPVGRLKGDRPP